jgi:putative ABC transport system ATP-binding protein
MLELDEVRKYYESPGGIVRAVEGATLSVGEGEVVAIFGPSGSGKTTLLMLAAALLRPDAGTVRFAGTDLSTLSRSEVLAYRRRELGFVYQNFNLVPGLTAEENVSLALLVRGERHRQAWSKALTALELVGLSERAGHLPAHLSGGEQQRVALARALVGEPRLVLADEPTGNLDNKRGAEVLTLLSDLAHDRNIAVVLVTHDVRAVSYAQRAHVLEDGKLVDAESGDHTMQLPRVEKPIATAARTQARSRDESARPA